MLIGLSLSCPPLYSLIEGQLLSDPNPLELPLELPPELTFELSFELLLKLHLELTSVKTLVKTLVTECFVKSSVVYC